MAVIGAVHVVGDRRVRPGHRRTAVATMSIHVRDLSCRQRRPDRRVGGPDIPPATVTRPIENRSPATGSDGHRSGPTPGATDRNSSCKVGGKNPAR